VRFAVAADQVRQNLFLVNVVCTEPHRDIGDECFCVCADTGPAARDHFDVQLMDLGGEVWFYTCLFPNKRYPNRLIDYPLLKVRLLHWLDFVDCFSFESHSQLVRTFAGLSVTTKVCLMRTCQ
jgi:hypothetical protein